MRGAEPQVAVTDQALLARVRRGDSHAYGELWRRHAGAVTAILRLETRLDADDLTAEVFTRILAAIRSGSGPDTAFRPYALVAARNLAAEWGRRGRREISVAEESLEAVSDAPPLDETVTVLPHRHVAARVFSSLPTRWQEVLWYLEVEQLSTAEAAALVGLNANSTVQLAFRAREGFRQAWIQEHLSARPAGTRDCAWADSRIGRHVRGKLAVVERGRFERHAAACERCAALVEEGHRVEQGAIFVLLPMLLLGGAASGYLAAAANGETRRSQEAGEPTALRFAKVARRTRQRPPRRGVRPRRIPTSALLPGAAAVAIVVVVAVVIALGDRLPEAIVGARPAAAVTAVPRDAAAPAPKPVTVPTSIPDAIAPPPTVDPALERDEADASERVSAPPAPAPQLVAPDPVVAIPASLVAMPEGLAYPHVVGTGTPGATIEVLVDYTGSPTLLTGVVGASGGFKIDAIVTAVVGDQWAIARQVVGGVASDWSDPFKVTIPPPPTLTWAWAGADKVTITAVAVTPFAPIYIVIDGVLAGTFTPAGPSGDLVVFPTSTLTPVVTATYSTGTESAPIATVPQH